MENMKAKLMVAPISLAILGITALILGLCGLNWTFFLIGGLLGLMSHSLMMKQNARTYRMVQVDPENKVFNPKKSAILWYLLRFALLIGVFAALVYKSDIKNNKSAIWDIVLALIAYMVTKIVFIACILIFKEKKKVIE